MVGHLGRTREYNGEGYSIVIWYDEVDCVAAKEAFDWMYRYAWDVQLRVKIRDRLGWFHGTES